VPEFTQDSIFMNHREDLQPNAVEESMRRFFRIRRSSLATARPPGACHHLSEMVTKSAVALRGKATLNMDVPVSCCCIGFGD
jgi:hypothetical protein